MNYSEKLRDPRWQKKRLEIMQRDGFACVVCEDTTKTLNVHHGYYTKAFDPWEYDNETLWTLCEDCHEAAEEALHDLRRTVAQLKPTEECIHDIAIYAHRYKELIGNIDGRHCNPIGIQIKGDERKNRESAENCENCIGAQ